jgi:hypothetical protein
MLKLPQRAGPVRTRTGRANLGFPTLVAIGELPSASDTTLFLGSPQAHINNPWHITPWPRDAE